ncbi:MAG: hypothetical protein PHS34_08475 [Candidatus Omnitrophica bacterium]|nr:hypothetical protein [Candidatus Omnitrophota bacterium]
MKTNQEILKEFREKFNKIDVNECGFEDGKPDNMVIIDRGGMNRYGLDGIESFLLQALKERTEEAVMDYARKLGNSCAKEGIVITELADTDEVVREIKKQVIKETIEGIRKIIKNEREQAPTSTFFDFFEAILNGLEDNK